MGKGLREGGVMGFYDSYMFDTSCGHASHKRDIGEKDGFFNTVGTWADAVINDVPLHVTFQFEDSIDEIVNRSCGEKNGGYTVVNSREMKYAPCDDPERKIESKWVNRVRNVNMGPMTFKESKKRKASKNKRESKPKTEVQKKKESAQEGKFMELVENNDYRDVEKIELQWHSSPSRHLSNEISFTFFPPEHWLDPVVRWDLIWSKIDEINTGKKRDYHYVDKGDVYCGHKGPCIFFKNKNENDMNYGFDWSKDFIYGEDSDGYPEICKLWCPDVNMWSFRPYKNREPVYGFDDYYMRYDERVLCRSDKANMVRMKDEFIHNPCEETWEQYERATRHHIPRRSHYLLTKENSQTPFPHI